MSDLAERVRSIGEQIESDYDSDRTASALADLHAGLRRRRARRVAAGVAISLLCLVAGSLWVLARPRPEVAMRFSPMTVPHAVPFSLTDGSIVTPLDQSSRLVAKTISPNLVVLELLSGAADFDVVPDASREFRVLVGRVVVVVMGTRFVIGRQGERARVEVQRGRVRVTWELGQQILDPGERGLFPPVEVGGEMAEPVLEPVPAAESPPAQSRRRVRAEADWRTLAQRAEYKAAYQITSEKVNAVGLSTMDDLLLAADVARMSDHALASIPYLERALVLYATDARAAVAAFTLGRVLLSDAENPSRAATAFARARAAAPAGPLAEDALAREVEACFRAGETERARSLAGEYVKAWPKGSHLRAIRHFGGIE